MKLMRLDRLAQLRVDRVGVLVTAGIVILIMFIGHIPLIAGLVLAAFAWDGGVHVRGLADRQRRLGDHPHPDSE